MQWINTQANAVSVIDQFDHLQRYWLIPWCNTQFWCRQLVWSGSFGRMVAHDPRGPQFESNHRRIVINHLLIQCHFHWKDKNKEKEAHFSLMLNNNNIRRKNVILQKGQIEWGWARQFDQSATDIAMTDRRAGNMTYDKVVDSNPSTGY